jgi:hypothetical protein
MTTAHAVMLARARWRMIIRQPFVRTVHVLSPMAPQNAGPRTSCSQHRAGIDSSPARAVGIGIACHREDLDDLWQAGSRARDGFDVGVAREPQFGEGLQSAVEAALVDVVDLPCCTPLLDL